MEIKHSISFFLQKVYSRTGNGEGQIRLRIRWNGNTYQANSGYTIQPERWETGDASGTHSIAGECQPPTSTGISDSVSEV